MIQRFWKARKLTQVQLAKRAGLTQGYIARLEGEPALNPSLPTLRRLAKALNARVADLLGEH
jgi:transcriptional regulator with XRE-family HTH domain